MSFSIKNKVAIITGAASGIGFLIAKDLLAHGLRSVTVVDVNEDAGKESVRALCEEFGSNKAIFVKADVAIDEEFEEVFNVTLKQFNNVDILINNAGIADESHWSRMIDVNLKGAIRGTLLGLKYISEYRTADSGLIVNVASTSCLRDIPYMTFYHSSKTAVMQVSRCLGNIMHYNKTKVRITTICPGITNTKLYHDSVRQTLSAENQNTLDLQLFMNFLPIQEPSHVSKCLMSLIENATSGSVWVIEKEEDAYELKFPERYGTKRL